MPVSNLSDTGELYKEWEIPQMREEKKYMSKEEKVALAKVKDWQATNMQPRTKSNFLWETLKWPFSWVKS